MRRHAAALALIPAVSLALAACSGGGSSPEAKAVDFLKAIDSGDATAACDLMLKEDYDTEYCLSFMTDSVAAWPESDPSKWSTTVEETDDGTTVHVDTDGRVVDVDVVQKDGSWVVDTWRDNS